MLTAPKLDPRRLLPPFEGSLPAALRLHGERELLEFHSLTRESYSTGGFLSGASSNHDDILRTISVGDGLPLHFEAGSLEVTRYCEHHALRLASKADIPSAIDLVQTALTEVIQPIHILWIAVSELVWRCHIIRAQDDDYDVSFSDPSIPFSVFISAPISTDRRSILRVAESLVHETMHLQLTLFETSCPLIDTTSAWSMYSPWKQRARPAQGVLHGLYVFYVLRWMWQQISLTTRDGLEQGVALNRIIEISEEISSVRALMDSPALTESGILFLHELFAT
jgi:hypothetical protein